jgi:hypothetical protein
MHLANSTKHTVTESRTFVLELTNESWHVLIHGGFEFGIIIGILFFTQSIDATLKRSSSAAKVRR